MVKRKASLPDFPQSPKKRQTRLTRALARADPSEEETRPCEAKKSASPTRLARTLPPHLHECLNAQKRAILRVFKNPKGVAEETAAAEDEDEQEPSANRLAFTQLSELVNACIERGETNSCLLIGPRNSGKTELVDRCIANCKETPIVVRLSGWAQHDDRQAMKEIGWQLTQQTGKSFISPEEDSPTNGEDEEADTQDNDSAPFISASLPPAHRISELISSLPDLSRPTIIIIEAIDLFTLHTRQALLYCLFDMIQTSRPGGGCRGVTAIGITNRIDTINLFEKRVKSRFSGRVLRTAPLQQKGWVDLTRRILCTTVPGQNAEWQPFWEASIDRFLAQKDVVDRLGELLTLTADLSLLGRVFIGPILQLSPSSPHLTASALETSVQTQCSRPDYPFLPSLTYPAICILIAFMHIRTSGHDTVNFETLYNSFNDQVNSSQSAPVHINGLSVGMVRCGKDVLLSAFESLVSMKILVAAGVSHVSREFHKYRCVLDWYTIRKAVEAVGNTNLKKWLERAA